jgi:hypothetical protein
MSELEGAVADGDGGGGGVAVLLVRPRRRWRALRGGLSLRRRVALDHFRPGFTRQRRQRRTASITRDREKKCLVVITLRSRLSAPKMVSDARDRDSGRTQPSRPPKGAQITRFPAEIKEHVAWPTATVVSRQAQLSCVFVVCLFLSCVTLLFLSISISCILLLFIFLMKSTTHIKCALCATSFREWIGMENKEPIRCDKTVFDREHVDGWMGWICLTALLCCAVHGSLRDGTW